MTGQGIPPSLSDWVVRAEHDLRTAEHTLTLLEDCPFDTVCFHAQQCAEKYVKALLLSSGVIFPYTHDLSQLLTLLPQRDGMALMGLGVEVLNPYTVQGRYPGPWSPFDRPEAEAAVAIAREVREVVRALLPPDAL